MTAWWELRYEWERVPHWWQPIYRHRYKQLHESIAKLEREHGIAFGSLPWQDTINKAMLRWMISTILTLVISTLLPLAFYTLGG